MQEGALDLHRRACPDKIILLAVDCIRRTWGCPPIWPKAEGPNFPIFFLERVEFGHGTRLRRMTGSRSRTELHGATGLCAGVCVRGLWLVGWLGGWVGGWWVGGLVGWSGSGQESLAFTSISVPTTRTSIQDLPEVMQKNSFPPHGGMQGPN